MIKIGIYIALFVGILYTAILFGMPYYQYKVFKSDLEEMTKIESVITRHKDMFIEKVMKLAEDSNIPITEENIKFHRDESNKNDIDISVEWTTTVDLHGIYQHTYEFSVDTRQ